jgi:hypothetical protein
MPIVENKARADGFKDQPFCSPNRNVTQEPNGVTTPQFAGEIVLDTSGNCLWKAVTTANNSWVALTPPN